MPNDKLARFSELIFEDARTERNEIMDEIRGIRSARLKEAEDALRTETYEYVQAGLSAIRAEHGRAIARRSLETERSIALRRSEIQKEVFDAVRARIREFTASGEEYPDRLRELSLRAYEALGSPDSAVIFLRPEDMRFSEELSAVLPECSVVFREGSFTLGGLIFDCAEEHRRADASFDSALADLSGDFVTLFGLSLMSE